jgi:8-oxo-dGTP diphosphatase
MTEDQAPPMSRPRVAAGALFFDEDDRVLLVKPTYKKGWDIPGGYVEPGETPSEACAREVKEELGLDRQVGRLLVADWAPSDTEGDKILFVFDGGRISGEQARAISLPPDELQSAEFHSRTDLDRALIPRLARRIDAALDALEDGHTDYLEHGVRASI